MAKWSLKAPRLGDIIRVDMGKSLHHYGIYVSDDEVIQYGKSYEILGPKESVCVLSTTIMEFLNHKFLEVREYSFLEKLLKNKPDEVVKKARARLGEAKYDALNNNCEHFVNECVFNRHESEEAEKYSENC
jgi:hypothetical protein